MNFYQNIDDVLIRNRAKALIIWPGHDGRPETFTGADIKLKVDNTSALLHSQGVGTGDKVMLALPVSIDALCSILALQKIGAIPVLPPSKSKPAAVIRLLRTNNTDTILFTKSPAIPIRLALHIFRIKPIVLLKDFPVIKNPAIENVPPQQEALISFSSGSTGQPKAIRRSHAVLTAQHLVLKQIFPPQAAQRDFPLFPNILLHNLSIGVLTIMPAIPGFVLEQMDAKIITRQIEEMQVTTLTGNVFYFKKIIQQLEANPGGYNQVTAIGIGGSPVPENIVASLREYFPSADCFIIYGSSEAEPIAIRKIENNSLENPANGYCVGKPVESIQLRIEGENTLVTSFGEQQSGEVLVQGAHVATSDKKWLKTGDYGYLAANGMLYLTGRKGNQTPHKGIQHYQLEHVLNQHAGVELSAAISTADGFNVFYNGAAGITEVSALLRHNFPVGIINKIVFRPFIPVDARHLSKVLYGKL